MASQRAEEALEMRWQRGHIIPQREPKVAYNGAEGMPIREEVIARHGDTVLTRNSYGAVCLNTPNIMFVDIDYPTGQEDIGRWPALATLLVPLAIWGFLRAHLFLIFALSFVVAVTIWLLVIRARSARLRSGRAQADILERVRRFVSQRPSWRARVYQTPAGLRVLALHRTFEPEDPGIDDAFEALGTDPTYATMCERQRCFRARLTGKPWRMGIAEHLRPRPGVWPVAEHRQPERRAWLERYDTRAREFAACRFIEELGTGLTDPAAAAVRDLHDTVSRATSDLPLA